MNRRELKDSLHELAKAARETPDLLPAAGILYSVCAALAEGAEMALFERCAAFSQQSVERLTGEPDWSDDTLKV